jgi:hypothetical protein
MEMGSVCATGAYVAGLGNIKSDFFEKALDRE